MAKTPGVVSMQPISDDTKKFNFMSPGANEFQETKMLP